MTLPEILQDDSLRRREFPVCARKIFLAHAAVCPLPRRVSEAMQQYLARAMGDDQEDVIPDSFRTETRELAARLIGAHRDEIAFTGSTSMGLAIVATGLSWKPGDNVVCYQDDYPANVYPWANLAAQGVGIRFVKPSIYGNVTLEDVQKTVDEHTKLVALASAHFVSGWRLSVDEIGRWLRGRGILFCLDGIQTIGALKTSVEYVDFAAADAHKWMLGPLGTAILYVRREHFDRLRPPLVGWHNAICPDFVAQDEIKFWPDARRYEPGSSNLTGLVGLQAALSLIHEIGIDTIESHILELMEFSCAQVLERGWQIVGPAADTGRSGILSFTSQTIDFKRVQEKLVEAGCVVSLRKQRNRTQCLRISPHFYNTRQEIQVLFDVI